MDHIQVWVDFRKEMNKLLSAGCISEDEYFDMLAAKATEIYKEVG